MSVVVQIFILFSQYVMSVVVQILILFSGHLELRDLKLKPEALVSNWIINMLNIVL